MSFSLYILLLREHRIFSRGEYDLQGKALVLCHTIYLLMIRSIQYQ